MDKGGKVTTRDQALEILGLQEFFGGEELKRAKRRAVMKHHPDKGGDPKEFVKVMNAVQFLQKRSTVVEDYSVLFKKESDFQKEVITSLKNHGCMVFNIHGHAMQRAGIPDLYVAHPWFHGWIELKTGDRQLTPLQAKTINDLKKLGVPAVVARYKDKVCTIDGMQINHRNSKELMKCLKSSSVE